MYLLCRIASKHNDYALDDAVVSRFYEEGDQARRGYGPYVAAAWQGLEAGGAWTVSFGSRVEGGEGVGAMRMADEPGHAECLVRETVGKDLKESVRCVSDGDT